MLYHIPVKSIVEYLDLNDKDVYTRLRVISKKLLSRVLDVEDGLGGWKQFQLVSESQYIPKGQNGNKEACLEMQLHKKLRPLLINLKTRFGSIPLRQIATMRSVNSIRLLEILYFQSHGMNRKELYFNLDDIKKRLGLDGMYKNFAFFRRDILEKSKDECSKKSPITFTYTPKKEGRKVVGIDFFLKRNEETKLIPFPMKVEEDTFLFDEYKKETQGNIDIELYSELTYHGLTRSQINNLLDEHSIGIQGVKEGLNYYKDQLVSNRIHSNKTAYLFKAIKEGWWKKTPEQKEKDQKEKLNLEIKEKIELWKKYKGRTIELGREELEDIETEIEEYYKKTRPGDWKYWKSFVG